MFWKIEPPESICICGASGSGKSTFVLKLLNTPEAWTKYPDGKILYCYGVHSKTVEEIAEKYPQIQLHSGLPDLSNPHDTFDPKYVNCLIADDLSSDTQSSPMWTNFLIRGGHHTQT